MSTSYSTPVAFSIHPKNHRIFLYRGKPMKILTCRIHPVRFRALERAGKAGRLSMSVAPGCLSGPCCVCRRGFHQSSHGRMRRPASYSGLSASAPSNTSHNQSHHLLPLHNARQTSKFSSVCPDTERFGDSLDEWKRQPECCRMWTSKVL